MEPEPIRVLIAEADTPLLEHLKIVIGDQPEFRVVGVAASIDETIVLAEEHLPQIVVLDIDLPGGSGFDLARRLVDGDMEVLVLVGAERYRREKSRFEAFLTDMLTAGAFYILLKPPDLDELFNAMRRHAQWMVEHGSLGTAPVEETMVGMRGIDFATDGGPPVEERREESPPSEHEEPEPEVSDPEETLVAGRLDLSDAERAEKPSAKAGRARKIGSSRDEDRPDSKKKEEESSPEPPKVAQPAPAPASPPPQPAPSATVSGDVEGNLEVAGGHIIKTNGGNVVVFENQAQAIRYEKQARRFDTAFPDRVELKKTAVLWVGVSKPSDPPPFEGVPAETIAHGPTADIPMPVDPGTGEVQEVHIDVQVRAPQYAPSKDEATLTVRPDGKPDKVRFLLEAQDEGDGVILVQFYLDKKRLGEVELKSVIEKARAGAKFAFTLQVATLYLAFGVA